MRKKLTLSVQSPPTRFVFKLLKMGFTCFKDWYYPEGQNEGGPKLQAEKPLNEISKHRHLENIIKEAKMFLETSNDDQTIKNAKQHAMFLIREKLRI